MADILARATLRLPRPCGLTAEGVRGLSTNAREVEKVVRHRRVSSNQRLRLRWFPGSSGPSRVQLQQTHPYAKAQG